MIGDKRLEMPKKVGEAWNVLKQFGLSVNNANSEFFKDANRLVTLNNEVYDKLQRAWKEGYESRIHDENGLTD